MKIIFSFFFFFFFNCFAVIYAIPKDYYFRHINTENGLSQNTVFSILQDKTGFMWFGTKDGLNRYDGRSMKIFKHEENNPFSLGNNAVWSLLETPDGNIWVGTERGIYIYNPENEKFIFFDKKTENNQLIKREVIDMKIDKSGNIWISSLNIYRYSIHTGILETFMYMIDDQSSNKTLPSRAWFLNIDNDNQVWISVHNGGIRKYNPAKNELKYFLKDKDGNSLISSLISTTINLDNNNLLIGSFDSGLRIMDKTKEEIYKYSLNNKSGEDELFIRTMKLFSDGNIWIGTESGLFVHNKTENKTMHLYHNINDRYSLSDNAIYSLYEDREGGIWIGTYFGGVNYLPYPYAYFEKYYPVAGQNSISGERVSGICEDESGNLWIGTANAGLNRFNPKTSYFEHFNSDTQGNGLNYHNVQDIIYDNDRLWIATYSHGINVLDLKTKKWKYYLKGEEPGMIDNNDIFAIYKDNSEQIWVGTSTGAFQYDKENDKFIKLEYFNHHFISDILEDSRGQIWFSTYNDGACCYNPRTKEYEKFRHDENDPASICYHKITCMFMDNKKRLWFGSESRGICRFDENTKKFVCYGVKDGFSNNVIYKILEDNDNNLWLSSNMGLMRFNPETKQIRIFTQSNGLPGNQFNYKSGYKDSSGRMYFGSLKGLVAFNPTDFVLNEYIPPVVITNFNLLNNESFPRDNRCNLSNISLSYNKSSFSIDFAALSYVAPEMNQYAYKMEGLESEWNYLSNPQKIIYSNLPPGNYEFKTRASNNDGLWNESGDSMTIHIQPPFWKTNWAYAFYIILLMAITSLVIYNYKKKILRDNRRKQLDFENKKEKEIYDAKIEFFTGIAHEIRTPLTLIKGPLEHIIKTDVSKDELQENLVLMEKNTNRLHTLINQLLDFRKTESQRFSLTFTNVNVNNLLRETYSRFISLVNQKELEFVLSVPETEIFADIDTEAVIKIISNLFTNAIKFAKSRIMVELSSSEDTFNIIVKNDGVLILKELKNKIFEPFFQIKDNNSEIKSGSGIGLALVKSLVELHEGSVSLDTDTYEMNTFIISLPKRQSNVFEINSTAIENTNQNSPQLLKNLISGKTKDTNSILVVEDDEELLRFLVKKLEKQYAVFNALNGVEAIEILKKEIINLVISDIAMPQMDGFELCSKIKQDTEYSHIPVVMLTAKTNIQSKITGLESGADAYIEKPFSIEHLQAQISNLLDNRKKIREVFANSPFVQTGTIALTKSDEQFLNKLTGIIDKNLANPDFNVDHLAEELFMSRSSLLRKIKGVSEFTPNDFIRLVRLKRAAEILKDGEYKVNEVCYLVGFSSTSYFSKTFQKQFGLLPKDFVKSFRKKEE